MASLDSAELIKVLDASDAIDPNDYSHWDRVRHLEAPDGLSAEHWWLAIKLARRPLLRPTPLIDPNGNSFVYGMPDPVIRMLHYVDQRCSGEIVMAEVVTAEDQARGHYLVNSLMEEAIRSSQLEGATTSRRVAKELLRSGRHPADRGERMILNNYRALQFMRDQIGDRLTPGAVLELHRILTEGTLDNPEAAGRLQGPGAERIAVIDAVDGSVLHVPPPASQLPERLDTLCAFANDEHQATDFVHPVIRGILLHFWLAYDHPLEDGNGRTARALFYWYMRTHGYWLVEYLSISRILRKAPSQYSRSFLLTETDERDTTYFLIAQLEVIQRAVEELHAYLRRKVQEVRDVERLVKGTSGFNHRQLALLGDASRNPDRAYSYRSHARTHRVTTETARADLAALHDKHLLVRRKDGRQHVYSAASELARRLRSLPA